MDTDQITKLVSDLASNHAWIVTALIIVGGLRIVFKPLMALLRAIADATPSTKDNDFLDRAEASKIFKTLCWLIDLLASIKVGTQKPTPK